MGFLINSAANIFGFRSKYFLHFACLTYKENKLSFLNIHS